MSIEDYIARFGADWTDEQKADARRIVAEAQTKITAPEPAPPIPGMSDPGPVSTPRAAGNVAPAQPNMRAQDAAHMRAIDPWGESLNCKSIAGIADAEVRAAHEALERYEDHVIECEHLLREDWASIATAADAREIEAALREGKQPPAKRVSAFERAAQERPMAIARARVLRDEVRKADRKAIDAFNAAAPAALPRLREEMAAKLNDAEKALADFVRATSEANMAHRTFTTVRISVERPLPTAADSMRLVLLDTQAGVSELDNAVQNARRRVTPREDAAK